MVLARGVWLRRLGDRVQVLVEIVGAGDPRWHLVIEESIDGEFSHIVEARGMLHAPIDPVMETARK